MTTQKYPREMIADMLEKKQFDWINHENKPGMDQRCCHCGEIYSILDRGVGGYLSKDINIVLCPSCNELYRKETWTERNIRNATKDLKKTRNTLSSFLEVESHD